MNKLAEIRKIIGNKFPSWPKGINFSYENNTLTLILTKEAVGVKEYIDKKNNETKYKGINMQDNSACFEGWAIGLKAWDKNKKIDKIYLDVDGDLPEFNEEFKEKEKKLSGHYGRFLYRALRFSEQYEWFHLCGDDNPKTLKGAVTQFQKKFLDKDNLMLVTNVPTAEASKPENSPELIVEYLMAENDDGKKVLTECLKEADASFDETSFGKQNVHHQLPVGLFSGGSVSKNTALFTYGHSDVDLWVVNANKNVKKLYVIELKAKKNDMLGIVTEIFFYSNYLYDLLVDKKFNKNNNINNNEKKLEIYANKVRAAYDNNIRGYKDLCDLEVTQIQGVMLANNYHALLRKKENQDAILCVMNEPEKNHYSMASYKFEEENNTITIRKGKYSAKYRSLPNGEKYILSEAKSI